MRINVFEGARRILLLFQVLWVILVLVIAWSERPNPSIKLDVALIPNTQPTESERGCSYGSDFIEWLTRRTARGTSVSVGLCFRANDFSGRQLVPYRMDEDGRVWGDTAHSENVRRYTEAYAQSFQLTPDQEAQADRDASEELRSTVLRATGFAVGGCAFLWLVAWVIGWIVRGFAGIPRGGDARPRKGTDV